MNVFVNLVVIQPKYESLSMNMVITGCNDGFMPLNLKNELSQGSK